MSWIEKNKIKLEENNYVLKADMSSSYWFGLSENKISKLKLKSAEFNIILLGNDVDETNYYVIPYHSIKDLLISENLYFFNNRQRWVGDIRNHILRIRNSNVERNVSNYFSLPISNSQSANILSPTQKNDYAIENAKREIFVRLKQSVFRDSVLRNFNYKCCLTNTSEIDLLVASHIIPWASQVDHRLNPGNGLCLSVLYDKLFDKGYFTLNNDGGVVLTSRLSHLSSSLQRSLNEIKGKIINSPKNPLMEEAILYHSTKIFERFHINSVEIDKYDI